MPVNVPCREYDKHKNKWFKCRTVAGGEEPVKEAGTLFLPALSEQEPGEYAAYKERALFYGATGRTVDGLLGAIFRKSPVVEPFEGRVKEELKSVTQDYQSYEDFSSTTVQEIIMVGRVGLLVDAPPREEGKEEGRAYVVLYQTEAILNWEYRNTGTGMELSMVVLEEEYTEKDPEDPFVTETKKQYRILEINEEGQYQQRVFRNQGEEDGDNADYREQEDMTVVPTVGGSPLEYIPFLFVNPVDTTATVYDPPILALANVNISHYRSSADLEHGRHFTGLPTAWVAGFDKDSVLRLGSQIAWVSEDPAAHAGFLEFTGQGLQSLENALKEKQEMMAVLGARMLEDPKRVAESNVALQTRYRGENNVLSSISKTVSGALSTLYTWLMEWRGLTQSVSITLNTDFINDRLSPAEVKALMESWQGGAMSWEVLFFNYKRGEVYPDDIDMEEERERIENEVDMDPASRSLTVPEGEYVEGELEEEVVGKGE